MHVIPQVHSGLCLGHPDHRLYVSHCYRDAPCRLFGTKQTALKSRLRAIAKQNRSLTYHAFGSKVAVHLGHLILVHPIKLRPDLLSGIYYELPEQVLWDLLHSRHPRAFLKKFNGIEIAS